MNSYDLKSIVKPIKLGRLLAILLYDSIILTAILLLAISLLFFICLVININQPTPHSIGFRLYLASIIISYYHICWAYMPNGQTIGMKAWKVQLVNNSAQTIANNVDTIAPNITFQQTFLRLIGGSFGFFCFGFGYLMLYFNKQNKTLADLASSTQYKFI